MGAWVHGCMHQSHPQPAGLLTNCLSLCMFCLFVLSLSVVSRLKLAGLFLADASLLVPRARPLPAVVLLLLIGRLDLALHAGDGGGDGDGGGGARAAGALWTGPQSFALLTVPHAVPEVDDKAWRGRTAWREEGFIRPSSPSDSSAIHS